MQRTLALAFASGLLGSVAFANIGAGMNGQAYLQAGDIFDNGAFGVPSSEVFSIGAAEPGVGANSTIVRVITGATSDSLDFDFEVLTSGASPDLGGADVILGFTLTEAATFNLTGSLNGLTLFQSSITGEDNPFLLFDELAYDSISGYFGTLVDGGVPMTYFNRQGMLEAGEYTFVLTSYSEAINGNNGFDGIGNVVLSLQAIPAPAGAFALAAPGLLLARRRRG